MDKTIPKWNRELDIFRKIKSCIIFEGNIFDQFIYKNGAKYSFSAYLHMYLDEAGYSAISFYDAVNGFENQYDTITGTNHFESFQDVCGGRTCGSDGPAKFTGADEDAPRIIERAMTQRRVSTALILDFASRYISDPERLDQDEVDGFTILTKAVLKAADVRTDGENRKNICIIIVNKLNDLPAWFYLDNPAVKNIVVQKPSAAERMENVSGDRLESAFDYDVWEKEIGHYRNSPDELDKICKRFVGLTEGFTNREIFDLKMLCNYQKISIKKMCSVIDLYKFGIIENPWDREELKTELLTAEKDLNNRVKGQKVALTHVIDVIKRAVTGMADISSSSHGKPKGVLFFAGPTGTGKTETAKALAEKLFGDESACIRFDMSEYRESNSDQRLLGAPPGYVGYESGGQLTNAIKENPFSILLFDEIEKANPSILDKFLQILEDGRMTDGKGETVYFSECVIIFTSNLGIYEEKRQPDGSVKKELLVSMDMDYEELMATVRSGVERYFKEQLGRPEILNRIGDNIVVYDFIRPVYAEEILTAKLDKIVKNLYEEKNIELVITEQVRQQLFEHAKANLENGGRGIGNIIESLLINPLSRFMFDNNAMQNCRITITGINDEKMPYSLDCSVN